MNNEGNKNSKNSTLDADNKMGDVAKLRGIARTMIQCLEEEIASYKKAASNGSEQVVLFGNKNSLIGALTTLTDLLAKLDAAMPEAMVAESEDTVRMIISDEDVALLESFIAKQRVKITERDR